MPTQRGIDPVRWRICVSPRGAASSPKPWLADPTTRYRHFVLGAAYEAASLMVKRADGHVLKLMLPADSVFEDRQPRLADLDGDGRDEIVLVRSYLDRGAALVVIGVKGDRLEIVAETPPTGSPRTWLNPAAIADFDGDGRVDIAYVRCRTSWAGSGCGRCAADGWSRLHRCPMSRTTSREARGSALPSPPISTATGSPTLAIPSLDRKTLRFITFKGGARELRRKPLPSPAVSDFPAGKGRCQARRRGWTGRRTQRQDRLLMPARNEVPPIRRHPCA